MNKQTKPNFTIYLLNLAVVLTITYAYPTGAPDLACKEMKPYHPATTTTGDTPFQLNITESYYRPGSVINGVLYASSGVKLRGFLIEVRLANDSSVETPLGEFINLQNYSHTVTSCGNSKSALTHTDNSNKTSVQFTWLATSGFTGDVIFKATVVESYTPSRYWMGITSDTVDDCRLHSSDDCEALTTFIPSSSPTSAITQSSKPSSPVSSSMTITPSNNPSSTVTVPATSPVTVPATSPVTVPATSPVTVPATSPGSGGIAYDPACGTSKGCFPDCKGTSCSYLVTWQAKTNNGEKASQNEEAETVDFEIQMKLESMANIWIAVGISPDGNMDGTNVMACLSPSSGGIECQSSRNVGYTNQIFPNSTTQGLSDHEGSIENGIFSCKFSRVKSNSAIPNFFDLQNEYYLLVGTGAEVDGTIQQHQAIPYKSADKVNFMAFKVEGEDDSVSLLIKLHASLMIIAWVLLSSVGIVVARQCKNVLGTTLLFKLKAWFVFHRTLMILATVCVIAAFIAIFVEVKGFSQIKAEAGKEYTAAHPYLGIVVTSFTLINPLMALFRPSPHSPTRFIFNRLHFAVGTSAHILAIITIFIGLDLQKAKINSNAIYIMATYAGIFVIVQTILEIHRHNREKKESDAKINKPKKLSYSSIDNEIDMSNVSEGKPCEKNKTLKPKAASASSFSTYFLVFHAILMLIIAAFMVAIVCMPKQFDKLFGS